MSKFSDKAKAKFFAYEPHLWGEVEGHKYYECPVSGDESPMVVETPEGDLYISHHGELEDQAREFDFECI